MEVHPAGGVTRVEPSVTTTAISKSPSTVPDGLEIAISMASEACFASAKL